MRAMMRKERAGRILGFELATPVSSILSRIGNHAGNNQMINSQPEFRTYFIAMQTSTTETWVDGCVAACSLTVWMVVVLRQQTSLFLCNTFFLQGCRLT